MIEQLADLPEGVIGFRASGKISRDEYHDQLLAPFRTAVERGDPINMVFVADPSFAGLDMGALWQDVQAAGSIGLKHQHLWRRTAIVTDKDWLRHAVSVFGWLSPGELRVYEPDRLGAAVAWAAGTY